MSIRSWQAQPSHQIELDGNVWPVVSQEDLVKALVDGAIMLDRAGGCLQVVLQRRPTSLQNEMVTVAAVVVWMDRTNAKPQPEAQGLEIVDAEPARQPGPEPEPVQGNGELDDAAALEAALAAQLVDDEAVDETDVPEHLRG